MSQHGLLQSLIERKWIALVLALLLAVMSLQVAFAAGGAMQPAQQISAQFPRLVLTLDESGAVTNLGVVISEDTQINFAEPQLGFLSTVLGLNLRTQMFDAATMEALTDATIQHVEIQTVPEGIAVYGNGQFLLGVKWGDQEVLTELAELAEAANIPFAAPMTQIAPSIGADILVELPKPAGAERIAPRPIDSEVEFPSRKAPAAEAAFVLHARGEYATDGTAHMLGAPLSQWGDLLGVNLTILNLDPTAISTFQEAGIEDIGISIDSTGMSLLVDGDQLATLVLGDEESLELTSQLAERFQIPFANFIPLVAKTQDVDIQLTVALPSGS